MLLTVVIAMSLCACGDTDTYDNSSSGDVYESTSDYSSGSSSSYSDDYDSYDDDTYDYNSYDDNDNDYDSTYTDDYSYDSDDAGYGYDKSDPFYSANDHNGDGKINDEEFSDAMSDALDYYFDLYGIE